ncbi:hypothetical protein EYF80_033270 [Liparis tanakae]|uniref:Uncharacterized protein n=1 Tax=Liparis tanakae TaxID=230148 RepID=A0A4Z2GVA8_9TELE|nr:hypothetical protein EYF80_033270 [Liparis tanakae]
MKVTSATSAASQRGGLRFWSLRGSLQDHLVDGLSPWPPYALVLSLLTSAWLPAVRVLLHLSQRRQGRCQSLPRDVTFSAVVTKHKTHAPPPCGSSPIQTLADGAALPSTASRSTSHLPLDAGFGANTRLSSALGAESPLACDGLLLAGASYT